jgi:hypothetical protein
VRPAPGRLRTGWPVELLGPLLSSFERRPSARPLHGLPAATTRSRTDDTSS